MNDETDWGALAAGPFHLLLAWGALLLFLLVAGWVLSGIALRSAERLPPEPTGRPVGFDAWLRHAYRGLLWAASAFYYLSLPLMVLLVLAVSGGIVYAMVAGGRIYVKLVVIVLLFAGATVYAVLRSLFVRIPDEDPGTPLDLAENPRLRAVLSEVAARIGTRPVDRVFLTPGTDLAVIERGHRLLPRLLGRPSERQLIVGAGLLDGMRLRAFRAVLGHEYGHFRNEDTAGGGFALSVRRSLMLVGMGLAASDTAAWYNPVWLFVNGFFRVFLRISQGASRLQEILCDRWAAFAYGSDAFVEGMRHVIERSARFDAHTEATLTEVVERKGALANLYAFAPAAPPDAAAVATAVDEAMNHPASPYDSHPSPADRIRMAQRLAAPGRPRDGDEAPVWELFANREEIEVAMTDVVRQDVAEAHGVSIARAE